MLRRYAILSAVLFAVLAARAQYDPSFSHYWAMETSFNPAAVGKEQKLNVAGAYNMTLTGFENNPRTMYVGADMPLYFFRSFHGVGLQILNDEIGLFSHKRLNAQYAFKRRLLGGMLSIGVQSGLVSESFDGSKLDLIDDNDPAFIKSETTGTGFDLSGGIYYSHRLGWYAGLSGNVINKVVAVKEIFLSNDSQYAPTGIAEAVNATSQKVSVYTLAGQLLRSGVDRSRATLGLPAGIYVVGGKKVLVR